MARSGRVRGRQGPSRSTLRAAIRFHTWASGFTVRSEARSHFPGWSAEETRFLGPGVVPIVVR